MYCPHCAVNYESGQLGCINCGNVLKQGRKCHACDAFNSESSYLCNLCGIPLKKNIKKVVKQRIQDLGHVKKVCVSCSEEYDKNVIFCKKCGNPVKTKKKYKTSNKGMISKVIDIFIKKDAA